MDHQFQRELPEICRWLSKCGDFYSGREVLHQMSRQCSRDEIMEAYDYFRANSERFETEWRPAFLEIFPQVAALLPEIDPTEYWGQRLHQLVSAGDIDGVRSFLAEIRADTWHIPEDDCNIYPIEDEDEAGVTPIGKAENLGFPEIAQLLKATLSKIRGQPGSPSNAG